ncbi:MAG: hypothetical protein KJT03_02395 [Verrucomicrobiae bacterium]|nr:hypothetical protein [Verrucomicrobiae bacterium]
MPLAADIRNYVESDGIIAVEAEHFVAQSNDGIRRWFITTEDSLPLDLPDPDGNHADTATGGAYIEILPDTRTNHDEPLVRYLDEKNEANFSPVPGQMGILSYPVYFNNAGLYIFWARAYSTGSEDNGIHVGINGSWPESSSRVQLCEGKHQWTWSSAQRRSNNHCGEPQTVILSIPQPGLHTIQLSMREDGFELDKFILTKDFNFIPEGESIPASIRKEAEPSRGETFAEAGDYDYRLSAATNFFPVEGSLPYYIDKKNQAAAINASNKENRNAFSAAYCLFKFKPGTYQLSLVTLTEIDGESEYQVLLNDQMVGRFTNPQTKRDYQEVVFGCGKVSLKANDKIEVRFNAVTNGKIPENDETAFSRGRWRGIILQGVGD